MGLVVGALGWMNAGEGIEASQVMDEIPGQHWEGIVVLMADFLEKARRRRAAHQARTDDYVLPAAVATVMRPQSGGGWITGCSRNAG